MTYCYAEKAQKLPFILTNRNYFQEIKTLFAIESLSVSVVKVNVGLGKFDYDLLTGVKCIYLLTEKKQQTNVFTFGY